MAKQIKQIKKPSNFTILCIQKYDTMPDTKTQVFGNTNAFMITQS